jgi:sec-independent protein translocase protein TatA
MNAPLLAFLGTSEIVVIAVVVLILFGAKKVPELMKGVGTGIKEFKKASRDVQDEIERAANEPPTPPPTPKKPAETVSQSGDTHA